MLRAVSFSHKQNPFFYIVPSVSPTQWMLAQRLNRYLKAACKFGNITLAHDGPCKGKGKGEIYIPLQSCSILSTDSDSGTEMKEGSGMPK